MSKRLLLNFLAVAVCALCLCSTALAQFNASLSGTVQDSTGAVVANATVTLVNLGTNQTQTTVTPNTGFYRFGQLPPGHYKLTATAAGFKGYTIADVNIAAETARSVNVNLAPGEATDTVNVTADQTPVLQTADASIGSTIDSEQIHRLPVFGANPYELLRTIPGIAGDSARSGAGQAIFLPNASGPNGSNSGVFQTENQTQISANGQRAADNNYTLDGVSVNSLSHGGAAVVTPNQEAIGQMTVLSTSYDAADGRNTGAQIKSITKNGTNDMHGSLFFLYDEPGLNAYNKWGGPTPGSLRTRAENKQRNWIASLGGPIAKDKLFYFFSWQGYTQVSNSYASQGWVETSAFRSLIQATRPGSVGSALFSTAGLDPRYVKVLNRGCADYSANQSMYPGQTDTNGLWCRAVGNGIDVGSPTAGGATQIGQYPTYRRFDPLDPLQATNPNLPSQEEVGGGLDNVADLQYVQFFKPGHSRGNQWNARGDWQITSSDLLAGSVYFTKLDNLTAPNNDSRPQGDIPFKPLNSAATILWIHTFSSAWINEFRANGTRFKDDQLADSGSLVNYGIPEIHLEGLPYTSANASAPQIQFGVPQGSGGSFAQNTIEFRDTVTHTFGSHILKAGVEFRFEQDNDDTVSSHARPVYSLRGLWNLANDTPVFEGIVANPNTGGAPSL
ncbi:MAG TPA: carboxypeptidase regulatory-like domain-containing protein, partial [Acidobacteriaceae bacterium]